MLKILRDSFTRWKFRISYSSGFLTMFASIIILSNTFQEKVGVIGISIKYWQVLIIVSVIIFIGAYLFDKLGFIESEIEYSNSKNKLLKDIGGKNGSDN